MNQKSKKVKILGIILISLVGLYFIANLGIYFFIKHYTLFPETNVIPQRLIFEEERFDSEYLHIMGLKLKFPFYKEEISKVSPFQILKNSKDFKAITISTDRKNHNNLNFLFISGPSDTLLIQERKTIYDSSFDDYSWWNIQKNISICISLTLKTLSILPGTTHIYEIDTSYIKGFLIKTEKNIKNKRRFSYYFEFQVVKNNEEKNFSLHLLNSNEKTWNLFTKIISSIKIDKDVEKSYSELEEEYKNKNSKYPQELLLASMLSLKEPIKEELEIIIEKEEKNLSVDFINALKKNIELSEELNNSLEKEN